MSAFSKGDTVRCIKTWTTHVIDRGGEYTVEEVRPDNLTDTMEALVCGDWVPFSYFEKVEPEFVVGQQVSGDDYKRVPVGSVVEMLNEFGRSVGNPPWTKRGNGLWTWLADQPGVDLAATNDIRTLTRLPEAAEPEVKDDLYVGPEPLKEGTAPAFNDDDVHHLKVISGSTTVFDGLAVFEEAENGNITVTPVPRCTSLFEKAGSILRCGQHEGHADGHWTIGSTPAASWSDKRACGRLVESDGAS